MIAHHFAPLHSPASASSWVIWGGASSLLQQLNRSRAPAFAPPNITHGCGLQMPFGCVGFDVAPLVYLMPPFPALPCPALLRNLPSHPLVKNMQGGLHYRLHSRSVRIRNHSPGRFDWASSLVDLPKRRPPLLLWRRAMFSLSTGHGYANVIDLLRAAAGDLRTEIVRVAFSILSQSITIWARSLNSQVSLPPRNQLDNGLG